MYRLCSYGLSMCDSLALIWRQGSGGKRLECVASLETCERQEFPVLSSATVMRNRKTAPNMTHRRCQFVRIAQKRLKLRSWIWMRKNKKGQDGKKWEWHCSCNTASCRVRVTTLAMETQNALCVYCWATSVSAIQEYWMLHKNAFLDFKLSPCFESCMYSFGYFPGVWLLYADVAEHSICSILIGWIWCMKYG